LSAPSGFRFTSGVCDPKAPSRSPWACQYEYAIDKDNGTNDDDLRGRTLKDRNAESAFHRRIQGQEEEEDEEAESDEIGIQSGRSTQCVYVDNDGNVQHALRFGVRRVGDSEAVGTNVAIVLEFDEEKENDGATTGRRLFEDIIRTATVLDEHVEEDSTVTTRYLLGEEEKKAVGAVTAEVLAATLDGRLAKEGIQLESVNPKEVVLSSGGSSEASKLAVNMEIKGSHSPPPYIDFDYIVSESINADSDKIRRGLQTYNNKCNDQTTKVQDKGYGEEDFAAVVSNAGASRVGRNQGRPVASDVSSLDTYSTACSSALKLPDKFETSLKEIEARSTDDLGLKIGNIIMAAEESGSGMDAWATGPVAAIAGLIVLLMGGFVFRRALGPRRADKYTDTRKTKGLDAQEMRRFGEAGGAMDDGSVDSAFYSDSESDLEETDKERKMRRKRKEKDDDQRKSGGGKSSARGKSTKNLSSKKKEDVSKSEFLGYKIDVSNGSDDTESVGKYSRSSSDDVAGEKRREKKRSGKDRTDRKKTSSSSSKKQGIDSSGRTKGSSSSKRGRSKRSGGDNANIV
jgi:hypothetical protein